MRKAAIAALVTLVVAGSAARVSNAVVQTPAHGHDARSHGQYLDGLLRGTRIRNRVDYALPQAYAWTALHVRTAEPFVGRDGPRLRHVGLALGNTHLWLWLLAGLVVLSRRLELGAVGTAALLALVATSPVVHRSLSMLRPENLALAFVPWLVAWAFRGVQGLAAGAPPRWPGVAAFAALLAVVFSTKIGGLTILVSLALAALVVPGAPFRRRLLYAATATALAVAFAVPLYVGHHALVGRWFYQHPTFTDRKLGRAYAHVAPRSFYWPVRVGDVWERPVREHQRGSMGGILWSDLYGDYWQYGVDHKRLHRPEPERVARQRAGLVATALFALLVLAGLGSLAAAARDGPDREAGRFVLTSVLLFTGGALAYVGLSCQVGFDPGTGNLVKWEYVGWCVPILALPVARLAATHRTPLVQGLVVATIVALGAFGLWRSWV